VRLIPVVNRFFGGNIGVAGLLTGSDLADALAAEPVGHRYLIPDACLSEGRFLDDLTVDDLPRPVEVVPTDGASLRRVLDPSSAVWSESPPGPTPAGAVPVVLGAAP
jgi:NifB/MoaA-like Fe-S oxidoreductase